MPEPPELSLPDLRTWPVTALVALGCTALTVAWLAKQPVDWAFMDVRFEEGQLWRAVTSCFLHGDVLHLLFNLYWLWIFGRVLETGYGSLKLAGLCLFLAVGSSLAQYALDDGGVGLSGVGYGLWAFVWVASRKRPELQGAITRQINALFIVWFVLCIALTAAGTWRVGNVAHGAGALLGALSGLAVTRERPRSLVFGALAAVLVALGFVGSMAVRPAINFSGRAGNDAGWLGFEALKRNDSDRAIALFRRALQYRAAPEWWCGLCSAYHSKGDLAQAAAAMENAYRLDRRNQNAAEYLAADRAVRAYDALQKQQHEEAIRLYREALGFRSDQADVWYNLFYTLWKLGRKKEAGEALRKASALAPEKAEYLEALKEFEAEEKAQQPDAAPDGR